MTELNEEIKHIIDETFEALTYDYLIGSDGVSFDIKLNNGSSIKFEIIRPIRNEIRER